MAREFIAVIVGIAISVGFIVVLLAMYTAVLDRTREVGILKALGASPFLYCSDLLAGSHCAYLGVECCSALLLRMSAQSVIHSRFPLVTIQFLESHIGWATVISVVGSILGTAYPARRAAGLDAIDALAYE